MGQQTNGPQYPTNQRKLAREKEDQDFEDALIHPDDPIPPRETTDEKTMDRYNLMREEMGLPPLTIEEFGVEE